MNHRPPAETLAARHARLFDRSKRVDVAAHVTRVALGVLVVASVFGSLYLLS